VTTLVWNAGWFAPKVERQLTAHTGAV
jgi:WD40 repeat protein